MSAHTLQELQIMQGWPLERKVSETKALIAEWYDAFNGLVYVSFSAGKDSTLLLHLAREVHPGIPAVYVDTGVEYPENVAFAKTVSNVVWLQYNMPFDEVIRQFGIPLISKEVSKRIYYARRGGEWAIMQLNGFNKDGSYSKFNQRYKKWRFLLDAPFPIAEKCCGELKTKPLTRYQRESGRVPITGVMACESARRQSAFLKTGCNVYRKRNPTSKPLSFWLESDVLRYLKENNISYSKVYGDIVQEYGKWRTTGAHRTGCMYCPCGAHLEKQPNRFQRMAVTHPEQYDYCINELGYGAIFDYVGIPYAAVREPEKSETKQAASRPSVLGALGEMKEKSAHVTSQSSPDNSRQRQKAVL